MQKTWLCTHTFCIDMFVHLLIFGNNLSIFKWNNTYLHLYKITCLHVYEIEKDTKIPKDIEKKKRKKDLFLFWCL
jgi:hypothetical protein